MPIFLQALQTELEYAQIVILSVDDENSDMGVSVVLEELMAAAKVRPSYLAEDLLFNTLNPAIFKTP